MVKLYDYELIFIDIEDGQETRLKLSNDELLELSNDIASGYFQGSIEVNEEN